MKITEYLRDAFSFSKLDTFSKCPKKFFYRYIMRKRENTGFQLFGRAVHKGQEEDNKAKLEGRLLPIGSVLEVAVESYKAEGVKEGMRVDVDPFVETHKKQLEVFEERGIRAQIHPVKGTVEAPFEMDLKIGDPATGEEEIPAKISGFVDVVSEDPARPGERFVVDYKTGLKPVYQGDADSSLQFALYALGSDAKGARAVSFVKEGRQKPTTKITEPSVVTEARKNKLLTWIADTLRSIRRCLKTGDFPKCSPSCTWCHKKACDFFPLCYPEKDADLPKLVQIEKISPTGTVEQPDWRK